MVTIPSGIENGTRLALHGQGDAGQHGVPSGDLYVFVRVKASEYYEREGADLYCAVPLSITQASIGGEISVTTLDGKKIKVKIHSGTQNGKLLRVRGEGIPVNGRKGDLIIKLMIKVPEKLSKRGKELLEQLSKTEGENESPPLISLYELANGQR
jgi:molecular chaperone DnaJ